MQEPSKPEPSGEMTLQQLQNIVMQMAGNQQQMFTLLQNQPPAQPAPAQPQPQMPAGVPNPSEQDDLFGWNTPPAQMPPQPPDPTQNLLMHNLAQLNQQVNNLNQNFEQSQKNLKREQDIQALITTNGINREYAEKAQDLFEKGEYQKGSQVLALASAPVIARMNATDERDARRDAAGQPLTPAPQGGVRTTPDEMQAINAEWQGIMAQPDTDLRKLAIIEFTKKHPQVMQQMFANQQQLAPPIING